MNRLDLDRRVRIVFAAWVLVWAVFLPNAYYVLAQAESSVGDDLGEATPFQNWQLLLGVVLPLIIAGVTGKNWSTTAKSATMLLVSAIATIGGMWLDGSLDTTPIDVVAEILKVAVAVVAFYYGIWKPVGTTEAIHKLTG